MYLYPNTKLSFSNKQSTVENISLQASVKFIRKGGIQQEKENYLTYPDLSENLLASHYSSSFPFLSPFPDPALLCSLISALNLEENIEYSLFRWM